LEETDNYSEYTKVLGNKVWSSIEITRSHIISYRVIEHKLELDKSIPEEDE